MSLRRTGDLLIRYSDSPSRNTRRVTVTVSDSKLRICSRLSMVRDTSARERGFRDSVPVKITSSILAPRIFFACFSPRTHLIESTIFDFPQPFGPTITVMPCPNSMEVFSGNDLKPNISIDLRYIHHPVGKFIVSGFCAEQQRRRCRHEEVKTTHFSCVSGRSAGLDGYR